MIKEVRLEKFRSFKELKIAGFSRLNVFIGKNNLGKSALLEALYLVALGADLIHISPIWNIMRRRGLSQRFYNGSPEEVISYLKSHFFYKNESCAHIRIGTSQASHLHNFEFKEYEELLKIDDLIQKNPRISLSTKRYLKKLNLREKYYVLASLDENKTPVLLLLESERKKQFRIVYLNTNHQHSNSLKFLLDTCLLCECSNNISEIIKKLEPELNENVYNKLKKIFSGYFETEIKSIEPSFSDLYVNINSHRIPFSMLGDGLRYFTLHYLILNLRQTSYLFFEEPENYMHPNMLNSLVEEIVTSRHQIFIVTHNLEFLQKLLWKAKVKEQDLKVFGFYSLSQGIPEIEIYDLKDAYINFNKLEIDLR
ncbi:MAG: AAA family ATPase [Desulfonauticus sp.]|nr:AAA family ATPase [Desulfonauticus sp.]